MEIENLDLLLLLLHVHFSWQAPARHRMVVHAPRERMKVKVGSALIGSWQEET